MVASDPELDECVQLYVHRVSFFTRQIQRRFMLGDRWHDELMSAGYWGLFKAARNRRSDAHERELSAYVSRRIQGAVIDEARSCLDRAVRTDLLGAASSRGAEESGDDEGEPLPTWLPGGRSVTRDRAEDPEHIVARRRRRFAIAEALGALEPEQREVIEAYMAGDSLSEIARARGVSPGTMQARFHKLARRLRSKSPSLRGILIEHAAN